MIYDDFERIGMQEGVPYVLCKLCWEWNKNEPDAFEKHPLYEAKLRFFFRRCLASIPEEALKTLRFIGSFEMDPETIAQLARDYQGRLKS